MAADAVGNRLDHPVIGDCCRATPRLRAPAWPERQAFERAAQKLDQEFSNVLRARLAGLAAFAKARRHHPGERAWVGFVGQPMQAIGEVELGARDRGPVRDPHGDDIVVDLVIGRKLDKLDRALPQSPLGSTHRLGRRS